MLSISGGKIARICSRSMSTPRMLVFLCSSFSFNICDCLGVEPLIHQPELRTYTKVVPFLKKKSSFHFVVLWKLLNGMELLKLIVEVK